MTGRDWNQKAKTISENREDDNLYEKNKDSLKNAIKIGAGIGFTGLTLGATLYAVDKSSEENNTYISELAFDYSTEVKEFTAYSFEAINTFLG